MKPWFMIICQTFATLGFGVNFVLSFIMTRVPNGHKIIADLLEMPNPPVMQIVFMTIISFMGTILLTVGNCQNMKWKETPENEKQIST